jgi:hypothetical protein
MWVTRMKKKLRTHESELASVNGTAILVDIFMDNKRLEERQKYSNSGPLAHRCLPCRDGSEFLAALALKLDNI